MTGATPYPLLLGAVEVAGLTLRNRIVMPPMNTAMDTASEQYRAWYAARIRGGVGLVIVDATPVYRVADPAYCERLRPIVELAHGEGVPVVVQVIQPPTTPEGEALAPASGQGPRAATTGELDAMPGYFATAARNLQAIGCDGIEPHGAHGFFLNQMFSPARNTRTDRYGGSLEARMALGLGIVTAIRDELGEAWPIFYRHTCEGEGYGVAGSLAFLERLVEAGVDVVDVSPSTRGDRHCDLAAEVRAGLDVPIIAVGGMEDPVAAEAALAAGKCDLVAVGRQLIADTEWPRKVAEGRLGEAIACTKCNLRCFGNLAKGAPIGCEENPASGHEWEG
jgi:2,4-dienoyl-CoA reductase-like NADH-dependent reductase (Old Yellow Enzyme family)